MSLPALIQVALFAFVVLAPLAMVTVLVIGTSRRASRRPEPERSGRHAVGVSR